jgi:hypothetical protein
MDLGVVIPTLRVERRWVCPACFTTDLTLRADVHTQFHRCPGLGGIEAPMVEEGTRCKIERLDREDYVGGDLVQRGPDGRPLFAVRVTRDDGTDMAVFAPTARYRADDSEVVVL